MRVEKQLKKKSTSRRDYHTTSYPKNDYKREGYPLNLSMKGPGRRTMKKKDKEKTR